MKSYLFRTTTSRITSFLLTTVVATAFFVAQDSVNAQNAAPRGNRSAKVKVSRKNQQKYLAQIQAALPRGVTFATATADQLAAAVAQVILAHQSNPAAVLEIVAAAVAAAQPAQVPAVAAGVAKAFAKAPSLVNEAPGIAAVIAETVASKEGTPKDLGATLGAATVEIVKALDKSNAALITETITSALTAAPALDLTATAYETVMNEVRQFDTDHSIEDTVTSEVISNVSEEVARQIVPNVDGPTQAKELTTNPLQAPNNLENTPERPVESPSTPL